MQCDGGVLENFGQTKRNAEDIRQGEGSGIGRCRMERVWMYNIMQRLSRHERHNDRELRNGGHEAQDLRQSSMVESLQDAALGQHGVHLLLLPDVSAYQLLSETSRIQAREQSSPETLDRDCFRQRGAEHVGESACDNRLQSVRRQPACADARKGKEQMATPESNLRKSIKSDSSSCAGRGRAPIGMGRACVLLGL